MNCKKSASRFYDKIKLVLTSLAFFALTKFLFCEKVLGFASFVRGSAFFEIFCYK
jgi:hypothetical protein